MPASASTCVPCASASPTVTSDRCGFERLAALFSLQCLGELVQLAFENAVEVVHGQLYAMVGDPVLRIVISADLLGPPARADLRTARRRLLGRLLLPLELVEPRAQHAQRRSEEHMSELHHPSISYAVFCLKKKKERTKLFLRSLQHIMHYAQINYTQKI